MMTDRLTQLQDAVDQLAQQMVASVHFVHRRHDLKTLSPEDQVQEIKNQQDVDPLSNEEFRAGMIELARDLITKEQEIEALASALPGLDNSEQDQHQSIKDLQDELKAAEAQRQEALKERDQVLSEVNTVIRSVRRPA